MVNSGTSWAIAGRARSRRTAAGAILMDGSLFLRSGRAPRAWLADAEFVQPRCSLGRECGCSRTTLGSPRGATLLAARGVRQEDPVQALLDDLEAAAEDKSADAHPRAPGRRLPRAGRHRPRGGRRPQSAATSPAYEKVDLEVYDVVHPARRGQRGRDVPGRVLGAGPAASAAWAACCRPAPSTASTCTWSSGPAPGRCGARPGRRSRLRATGDNEDVDGRDAAGHGTGVAEGRRGLPPDGVGAAQLPAGAVPRRLPAGPHPSVSAAEAGPARVRRVLRRRCRTCCGARTPPGSTPPASTRRR